MNDVGKKFEYALIDELKKTPIEVKKLGGSGYLDFELKQGNRVSYLEVKATANPKSAESTFRTFYYSSGRKVQSDARHLLIKIQTEEEQNK